MLEKIKKYMGEGADDILNYKAVFPKEQLCLPGPDFIDRVFIPSDRSPVVMRNLQALFGHGRLAGTGYLSILPVLAILVVVNLLTTQIFTRFDFTEGNIFTLSDTTEKVVKELPEKIIVQVFISLFFFTFC